MSDEPREYHLNFEASQEKQQQVERAERIIERLAAHLAATDPGRDPEDTDLIEARHVRQAGELLFGAVTDPGRLETSPHCVFVSFSHEDEDFVSELCRNLSLAGVTHFKADRDVRPAAEWGEAIWDAIRSCRVFLLVLTPRFVKSRWSDLESGAALASRKKVLTALRYVEPCELRPPINQFQSMVVENNEQLDALVSMLRKLCEEP
jgi:hypothetical protein